MSDTTVLLVIGVPGAALLLLCFLPVASFLSGWQELAKSYPCREPFQGERWYGQRAYMGFLVHYSLVVGASAEGLYLAQPLPCRPFHPPLLVPWNHISVRAYRGIILSKCELSFRRDPWATVSISAALAADIAEAAGISWRTSPWQRPRKRRSFRGP